MTKEKLLHAIREEVVKVVPEIADVSFSPIGNEGMSRSYKFKRKIQLADILLATSGKHRIENSPTDNGELGLYTGDSDAYWNLAKTAEDQDLPTLQFIAQVLGLEVKE